MFNHRKTAMRSDNVITDDLFKAAYLYDTTCCQLEVSYRQETVVEYRLSGAAVKQAEAEYLSGEADINPLGLKAAVFTLLTVSGQKICPETQPNPQPKEPHEPIA
jgi:hypothetical protein